MVLFISTFSAVKRFKFPKLSRWRLSEIGMSMKCVTSPLPLTPYPFWYDHSQQGVCPWFDSDSSDIEVVGYTTQNAD